MRLIDADALKKHYAWWEDDRQKLFDSIVDSQPTVDAVPVIRCVDCKHSDPWYRDKRRCFLWDEDGIDVFNDGYCNYGQTKAERKDDETD